MSDQPKRLVVAREVTEPRAPLRFLPAEKLILATGHVPIIRDDEPMWRRLVDRNEEIE